MENNRHALLIKSQTSLQLMYIINFDQNLELDEMESRYAKQSVLHVLPDLNWNDFTSQIKDKEIR